MDGLSAAPLSPAVSFLSDAASQENPDDGFGLTAGSGTCDGVLITPYGDIRHYSSDDTLVAHCKVHDDNCRLTRKGKSAVDTDGRPLGELYAWLRMSSHPDFG